MLYQLPEQYLQTLPHPQLFLQFFPHTPFISSFWGWNHCFSFFAPSHPGYYKVGQGRTQSLMSSCGDHLWQMPPSYATDTFEDRGFTSSSPPRVQTCAECISSRCHCCVLEGSPRFSRGTWRFIHVLCEGSQLYSPKSICRGGSAQESSASAVLPGFGAPSRSPKCFTAQTAAATRASSLQRGKLRKGKQAKFAAVLAVLYGTLARTLNRRWEARPRTALHERGKAVRCCQYLPQSWGQELAPRGTLSSSALSSAKQESDPETVFTELRANISYTLRCCNEHL